MNIKSTLLIAMLVPGMAMLSACKPDADTDASLDTPDAMSDATYDADAVSPPPATTDTMTPMPDDTAPVDGMNAMGGAEPGFAAMDRNMDGGVTQDELAPTDMLSEHFSVADANGDGKLTEAEINQHRADMADSPAQ